MSLLFSPHPIASLTLPNRIVRSATAECLASEDGISRPELATMWATLARGETGLIISGHFFVHSSGKAHPEMGGIHTDETIEGLAAATAAVHAEGGFVAAQINHGGMQCRAEELTETIAPSAIEAPFLARSPREMTGAEIEELVEAFAVAAGRAQAAGFDAVQIHCAHGYLGSQFLSPFVNRRDDAWGGTPEKRRRFLEEVAAAVRARVGAEYPLFVKLGLFDGVEGGLRTAERIEITAHLAAMGFDAVEISAGLGGATNITALPAIRRVEDEAYFRPLARRVREACDLPLILVGGIRSRAVMEEVLASGDADFVSMCRPLIREPDLPRRIRLGEAERAACLSGNRCFPKETGLGTACRCGGG